LLCRKCGHTIVSSRDMLVRNAQKSMLAIESRHTSILGMDNMLVQQFQNPASMLLYLLIDRMISVERFDVFTVHRADVAHAGEVCSCEELHVAMFSHLDLCRSFVVSR
jgi:hypothetical protein